MQPLGSAPIERLAASIGQPTHDRPWRAHPLAALATAALMAGCATAGPPVSRDEVRVVQEELAAKALLWTAQQHARVWRVGHQLVQHLPEDSSHPRRDPDLGVAVSKITKTARRAFRYPQKQKGLFVLAVREGGPAAAAGLRSGDIVLAVGDRSTPSLQTFRAALKALREEPTVTLRVRRGDETLEPPVAVGAVPRRIEFVVTHDQSVNAWARADEIGITAGLLRFLDSDDELAVVLGHELAHITEGHRTVTLATGVLATTVGVTTGVATEILLPGAGSGVGTTAGGLTGAVFSRGFEREADYQGLLHTYRAGYDVRAGLRIWERFGTEIPESLAGDLRSTHPASPERMVRIRKIADSLMTVGLDGTIERFARGGRQADDVL